MIYRLSILSALFSLFAFQMTCRGQEGRLKGIEMDLGVSLLTSSPARDVFPAAIKISAGPKWTLDEDNRLWLKAGIGADVGVHDLPDNYTEYLGMFSLGPEFQYDAYYIGKVTFMPYYKANVVYAADFDTYGDDEGEAPGETYLSGWSFSQEAGTKIQFGSKWYIRLGYNFFSPRLQVRNHEFQADLGAGLEEKKHKTFTLSTASVAVGFNLNFL